MVQTFNPDKVMLRDSFNTEVKIDAFTNALAEGLKTQSLVTQLGERVEMGNQYIVDVAASASELSDAYIVGEAEKIGVANLDLTDYRLETKKIAVILPASQEFLTYTWTQYFNQVLPLVVDKFAKVIDAGAFFGIYRGANSNPFGSNVLAQATTAGNVLTSDLSVDTIFDLEDLVDGRPNAYFGQVNGARPLRGLVDTVANERLFDRVNNRLDGIPYHELALPNGDTYPEGTIILGDTSGIKYGLPQGSGLRLKIADQATLSTVQNAGPDSGDFHLFEQDSQAVRAIFEIAVAIPDGSKFAILQPEGV